MACMVCIVWLPGREQFCKELLLVTDIFTIWAESGYQCLSVDDVVNIVHVPWKWLVSLIMMVFAKTLINHFHHTCQLSHIMRESPICKSKIVILCMKTNFSRLTDTIECNYLKTFKKWSEHLWTMLEIGGNLLEIVGTVLKLSKILIHLRLSSEVVRKSLAHFERHRKLLAIFGSLPKTSAIFRRCW